MEIIMITENKLKVMLTSADLKEFSLRTEDLDYSNADTKHMFWDILSQAKHTFGFDTDGKRVLVQLYPSRAGGCEMFITKLGDASYAESEENGTRGRPLLHCKTAHRQPTAQNGQGVFSFQRMTDVLAVCRRLENIGYEGESEAYLGDDRRVYLFLSERDSVGFLPLDEYSFLAEYGTPENPERVRRYVIEHAKALCESRAVEQLAKF